MLILTGVGFAWGEIAPPPEDPCGPKCGPGSPGCISNSDCPHSDPCLDGVCDDGVCSHQPHCFDELACTTDVCNVVNGVAPCDYWASDARCDDNNICTDDTCSVTDGCLNTNNSAPCDDELVCTQDDTCVDGICTGTDRNTLCTDGNFCTLGDFCDPSSGFCQPGPDSPCSGSTPECVAPDGPCVECLDESDCPGDEICNSAGECVECEFHSQCIADPNLPWCNPANATCVNCLEYAHCDDLIACTSETCYNNVCVTCTGSA